MIYKYYKQVNHLQLKSIKIRQRKLYNIRKEYITIIFMFIFQQFDNVIHALEAGQPVDLSQMPPPPGQAGNIS